MNDCSVWRRGREGAPVLFLDIDGVLHRGQNGSFERMPLLRELLTQVPGVDVVISSDWRLHTTPAYLRARFPADLWPHLCGVTPCLAEQEYRREQECREYVRTAGVTQFVAVDDDTAQFHPNCPFLVATRRFVGLDRSVVDHLVQRLRPTNQ